MKLYEINNEIAEIFASADEDGELSEEAFAALSALNMARETKIENIGLWIKDLEAEAKALKDEKQALNERQKAKENKAKSLREYLIAELNGEKFETARLAISWRKSSSVVIDDPLKIPADFLVQKAPDINRRLISASFKVGKAVPGAHIEYHNNIQIK